jgi:Ser/Thr protein kinase RdoA (MazF antagonist)
MMNVEIMWKEVAKIDKGQQCIGRQVIDQFNHDACSLQFWRVSANFIYMFTYKEQERVLRITPASKRTIKQIQAEIDFIEYLSEKGLPVLRPINSRNHKQIETLENENGVFHAVAYPRASGAFIVFKELARQHWQTCGRMMARLHNESLDFKPHKNKRRRTWKDDLEITREKLSAKNQELLKILDLIETKVEQIIQKEYYGLIHYDLCYDNIIWDGESYVIIDFDDAAYYPLVADIAFGIDDIREEKPEKAEKIFHWFSNGYLEKKSLPDDWKEQLKLFFDLEDIMKYARVLHAYAGTNEKRYPEWLVKLHKRHFSSMKKTKKNLISKWHSNI